MKISHRRDGSVVIFGDADDTDELIAEARINSFIPVRRAFYCVCGAPIQPWNLRRVGDGAELYCSRCHTVHAHLGLEVQVQR